MTSWLSQRDVNCTRNQRCCVRFYCLDCPGAKTLFFQSKNLKLQFVKWNLLNEDEDKGEDWPLKFKFPSCNFLSRFQSVGQQRLKLKKNWRRKAWSLWIQEMLFFSMCLHSSTSLQLTTWVDFHTIFSWYFSDNSLKKMKSLISSANRKSFFSPSSWWERD